MSVILKKLPISKHVGNKIFIVDLRQNDFLNNLIFSFLFKQMRANQILDNAWGFDEKSCCIIWHTNHLCVEFSICEITHICKVKPTDYSLRSL